MSDLDEEMREEGRWKGPRKTKHERLPNFTRFHRPYAPGHPLHHRERGGGTLLILRDEPCLAVFMTKSAVDGLGNRIS